MASTYPGAIDSTADSGSLDLPNDDSIVLNLPSQVKAGAHAAIIAVESTLGVNPQGSEATVDARLTATEGVANDALPGSTPLLQLGTTGTTAMPGDTAIPSPTPAETKATILSKLGASKVTGSNTGDQVIPTVGTAAALDTGNASGEVPVLGAGGVFDLARLATGTPDGTKYVADDGTLQTPAGGGGGGGGPLTGSGFPEGIVTADPGTEYVDTDITNGAAKWMKMKGTGNTGWDVATGDTGWRDVADSDYVSAGAVKIRRTANNVTVDLVGVTTTATGGHPKLADLVAGFRPAGGDAGDGWNVFAYVGTFGVNRFIFRNYQEELHSQGGPYAADGAKRGWGWWTTYDAWPATLPGDAA